MAILSKPSAAPRTALSYITVGSILTIWAGVWMSQYPPQPEHPILRMFCMGLLFTGIALLVIGFSVGWISRSARHAELPPEEATNAVAQMDQMAAARPAVAPPQVAPNPNIVPATTVAQTRP